MEKTELIFKILSKEASAEEVGELDAWINADYTNRNEYEDIKLLWEGIQSDNQNGSEEYEYVGFQNIRLAIKQKQRKRKLIYTLCAVLFLLIVMLIVHFFVSFERKTSPYDIIVKFDHSTLSKVAATFEDKYRVHLYVPTNLQTCEFTGIVYHKSPKEALAFIAERLNLEYSIIDQHNFSLNGRACKQKPI